MDKLLILAVLVTFFLVQAKADTPANCQLIHFKNF